MFSKFTFPQIWSLWKSYMAKEIFVPKGVSVNKSLEVLLAAELEFDFGNATYTDRNEIQIYNHVRGNCPKFWSCNIFLLFSIFYKFFSKRFSFLQLWSFPDIFQIKKKKKSTCSLLSKQRCLHGKKLVWLGTTHSMNWLCIFTMDAPNLQKHIS